MDDDCHDLTVEGNTVINTSSNAVFFHNNKRAKVINNLLAGGKDAQVRLQTDPPRYSMSISYLYIFLLR